MSRLSGPNHIVVDGSNIATEGRSKPSLQQLSDAVTAFMADHPDAAVTVVVDATFGHRIDPSEKAEFDEAVANNELVAPPAGAIGRGDAFVLTIADKSGATILSNDSFQEFHADYEWLFDEGRLVGGKPVPHVGWVFVARTPVRGPVSRKATKQASRARGGAAKSASGKASSRPSPLASQPMPVPTAPPPGRAKAVRAAEPAPEPTPTAAAGRGGAPVNELMPFLDFVEHHPVGTSCTGVVESYASHGAYVRVGEVAVYLPLRLMGDPQPRSARSVLTLGEAVTVVIAGFVPARRSIDASLPGVATPAEPAADEPAPARRAAARKAPARKAVEKIPATKAPAKKAAVKKVAPVKAPAKKAAVKKVAPVKAPAKKAAVKKVAPEKAPAKKAAVKKVAPEKAPVKKVTAKKTPAEKAPVKKVPAKKTAAKKSATKKASAS
jgi:hypothetical protein